MALHVGRLFAAMAILLSSCSVRQGPWVYREIVASAVDDTSALLHFVPPQKFRTIEFQAIAGSFGRSGYLGISSGCLPPTVEMCLIAEEEKKLFLTRVHLGSQIVELPPEALEFIFSNLLKNKEIQVSFSGYATILTPHYFPSLYSKFCAIEITTAAY